MMSDYSAARHMMVENQIRANRVSDPAIVAAFEAVPRERFVPPALAGIAYADEDLHIGGGRYLIEPMILGRLLQTAEPEEADVALDIACCTGYSTAILSRLVSSVVAIEADATLVEAGNSRLSELEFDNAALVTGTPVSGYPSQQPFNLILIAGGVERVPDTLFDQLAEGGRLVTVVYDTRAEAGGGAGGGAIGRAAIGRATIYEKVAGTIAGRVAFDAATPLLPGFTRKRGFVF